MIFDKTKLNVLIHYRHFPVAIGRYIEWGFEDAGHNVYSVGPYSGGRIPWGDQFYYPKWAMPPDYELPETNVPLEQVLWSIDFKPDIIVQAADTIFMTGETKYPNIIVATDPHVIDYTERLTHATHFVCMQKFYMELYQGNYKKIFMSYAYDPAFHYVSVAQKLNYDVVMCGLQYDHRIEAMEAFKQDGFRTFNALGRIYDDYRDVYCQGSIAFVWSSKDDLPARFYEGLAMKRLVLINRTPELRNTPFREDVHYIAFSTIDEAREKVKFYLDKKNIKKKIRIQQQGHAMVQKHTWKNRIIQLVNEL